MCKTQTKTDGQRRDRLTPGVQRYAWRLLPQGSHGRFGLKRVILARKAPFTHMEGFVLAGSRTRLK